MRNVYDKELGSIAMIREAKLEDLEQIVKVHIRCFPDSFSTQLGEKLLEKFYLEYLKEIPDLFLIAEEDSNIVGFCMGYLCEDNEYMKKFLKHNFIAISIRCLKLLLSRNTCMILKLRQMKKKENPDILERNINNAPQNQKGDLLSLCVIPRYRGTGIAQQLVKNYIIALKNRNREYCVLTVKVKNGRGIRFYEKNDFIKCKVKSDTIMYGKRIDKYENEE